MRAKFVMLEHFDKCCKLGIDLTISAMTLSPAFGPFVKDSHIKNFQYCCFFLAILGVTRLYMRCLISIYES